jgi:hypothetical protein
MELDRRPLPAIGDFVKVRPLLQRWLTRLNNKKSSNESWRKGLNEEETFIVHRMEPNFTWRMLTAVTFCR